MCRLGDLDGSVSSTPRITSYNVCYTKLLRAFDSGNEAVGGLLLFFEAGWYTGNIYNAASNAHKFNSYNFV